ncbi:MAG TPA: glycosyltransferase family 2 protein [archaeon]|nr:glycosyltransferase family 2 protein [archaeon]
MKYSIIICTKNEEESIAKVICSVPQNIRRHGEIIVVDSSKDYTPVIAERLGAKVIKEKGKGKGRAMHTGVENSKGEILIFLDGDGTDPPQFIPKLLKALENSSLVLGSRNLKNFNQDDMNMRRIFSLYTPPVRQIFNLVGFKVKGDPLAGFRAMRREDWDRLNLKSNDFTIEAEMNINSFKMNFKVKEVPIPHLKRGGGLMKSKLVTDPKMWMKILRFVLKHVRDEKVKRTLKNFKIKYLPMY